MEIAVCWEYGLCILVTNDWLDNVVVHAIARVRGVSTTVAPTSMILSYLYSLFLYQLFVGFCDGTWQFYTVLYHPGVH